MSRFLDAPVMSAGDHEERRRTGFYDGFSETRISKPLSAPQGQYRSILCSGGLTGNHLYACQPYYAMRRQWLKLARVHCLQIMLMCLGELVWINVREADLRPTGWKE